MGTHFISHFKHEISRMIDAQKSGKCITSEKSRKNKQKIEITDSISDQMTHIY